MRTTVPLEQWEALRELREGQPPSMPRLAAASQLAECSIKNRSFRHGWTSFSRWDPERASPEGMTAVLSDGEEAGDIERTGAATQGTAEERLARVSDMLLREVEAIGRLAQVRGKMPDKARIDAVGAMIRLLEKVEEFALAKGENGKNRDGEVADVLKRIDGRIEELARAYAKELGEAEHLGAGSGADPR